GRASAGLGLVLGASTRRVLGTAARFLASALSPVELVEQRQIVFVVVTAAAWLVRRASAASLLYSVSRSLLVCGISNSLGGCLVYLQLLVDIVLIGSHLRRWISECMSDGAPSIF
ncbi:hypothetical protein PENTCL1PPCAC_28573, partial [Pristionchus entomophagus]